MGFFVSETFLMEWVMIWLFDLDNTLHNASLAIFPEISANMNAFLSVYMKENGDLRLSAEAANQLRIEYWKRFGATLLGISKVLDQRARDFLEAAHRFHDLKSLLSAERGLPVLFRRLPGRKVLLTNSAYRYSADILKLLGVHQFFEKHIAIESMRVFGKFEPKPSGKFFRKLLAMLKVRPEDCVLVEDNIHILKKAKAMGMKTVLVTRYLDRDRFSQHSYPYPPGKRQAGRPAFIDLKMTSVRRLTHYLERFC